MHMLKLSALMVLCLLMTLQTAEAGRLGGGKSFGSRPSYNQSYQRSPQQAKPSDKNSSTTNNPSPTATPANNKGFFGRLLGGLLMGGLLATLLYYGGSTVLIIALIGLVIWLVLKVFKRRTAPATTAAPTTQQSLFDMPASSQTPSGGLFKEYQASTMPTDFDGVAFLQTAKALYTQLQAAWNAGDLTQLRQMTTDKVFGELQDQLRNSQSTNKTELATVDAQLLEVRRLGNEVVVSVLFDANMRELPETEFKSVREVYHFVQSTYGRNWLLEGIQQVDDETN